MRLGVIADDFTGATDIAGFLVENGMKTVMFNGVGKVLHSLEMDAFVVSLKIRSCKAEEAQEKALEALSFLQESGCTQFYYKYCSTFDSTEKGNIGPVTDMLMKALHIKSTFICPALPINGRTVYQGYLFVQDQLLNESSMRFHPLNPMLDAKLQHLLEVQGNGKGGHIFHNDVVQGSKRISQVARQLEASGINYLIVDVVDDGDLNSIAEAAEAYPLVTGGSGLAMGIAHLHNRNLGRPNMAIVSFVPRKDRTVVIAGSCSKRTKEQVAYYRQKAPSFSLDEEQCLNNPEYARQVGDWVLSQNPQLLSPLVYATRSPEELEKNRKRFVGQSLELKIEQVFGELAGYLAEKGIRNFIVGGGETSGVVATALQVSSYLIGPQIDPGVSWLRSLDGTMHFVFKSGNFGSVDFFEKAQKMCHGRI